MGKIEPKRSAYQFLVMFLVGLMFLIGQRIGLGVSIIDAFPGMMLLVLAAMSAMIVKDLFPKSIFPAFAWATIIGLILSLPSSPTSKVFMEQTGKIDFLTITTPILAFAGISVGNKIEELKEMSWKIVIVSIVVFITIFFACAGIAHFVLKLQGTI